MSAEPASSVRNSIDDAMPLRSMQTLQRVKALYEAWGRGAYGPVFEALDEGVVWELFAPPELPFAGVWRGRSEVSRFFSALEGAVEDPQHPMDEFLVSGDRVVAIGRFMGRARRSSLLFDTPCIHVWDLSQGRVARWRCSLDSAALVKVVLAPNPIAQTI